MQEEDGTLLPLPIPNSSDFENFWQNWANQKYPLPKTLLAWSSQINYLPDFKTRLTPTLSDGSQEFHLVNPQAPVAQKSADEVVFRRFQGEGVEFYSSDLTEPPLRFLMRIFWKIPIYALPDFIFQWVLYQDHVLSQMILQLIRTNEIEG